MMDMLYFYARTIIVFLKKNMILVGNKDHNEQNKTTLLLCLLSHIISLKWEVRLIKLGSPATFY
jgi:hypothetical protein